MFFPPMIGIFWVEAVFSLFARIRIENTCCSQRSNRHHGYGLSEYLTALRRKTIAVVLTSFGKCAPRKCAGKCPLTPLFCTVPALRCCILIEMFLAVIADDGVAWFPCPSQSVGPLGSKGGWISKLTGLFKLGIASPLKERVRGQVENDTKLQPRSIGHQYCQDLADPN